MAKRSAGLLLYRLGDAGLELLLAHPGGPYWEGKDVGAWSLPKGEVEPDEEPLDVARREFAEETGQAPPTGEPIELGDVRQASGKTVTGWAIEGDLDPALAISNTFPIEWPPRSGRQAEFPEVDRVEWFSPDEARHKLNAAQAEFVDRLAARLASAVGSEHAGRSTETSP
jgi:predicted NUDIX family NTP pyrophosphohydrolase